MVRILPTKSMDSTDYAASDTDKAMTGVNVSAAGAKDDFRFDRPTGAATTSLTDPNGSGILIVDKYVDNDYPGLSTSPDKTLVSE